MEKLIRSIHINEKSISLMSSMIILLLIFALVKAELIGNVPDYVSHIGHEGEEQFIYSLQDEQIIVQEFNSPRDFDFATINFSDHDTAIQGKTFLTVKEKETDEIVDYLEINNSEIHYGQPVKFLQNGGKKDTVYSVLLQFEGMGENGLGIYGYQSEGNVAFINGKASEYAVGVGTHTYTDIFEVLALIVLAGIVILVFLEMFLAVWTTVKEEYLFLGIAVPLGLIFLVFLSGNIVHDGSTHLARTYHYSNVLLGWDDQDETSYVWLKKDEAEVFNSAYEDCRRENGAAYEFWATVEDFWKKAPDSEMVQSHWFRATSASSFWEHFPGALGITVGRILGFSARLNILFAKIMFLTFYIGAVFFAIRLTPYLKAGFAMAALLPMAMYQATGITYDSVVMATAFLLIALFFRWREQKPDRVETVLFFVLVFILGCCKGGFYLVLLLPFLFIPAQGYGGKRKKAFLCIMGFVVGGVAIFTVSFDAYWDMIAGILHIGARETEETVGAAAEAVQEVVPQTETAAYGISYLFHDFLGFVELFVRTLAERTDFYLGSLIGYRMAWTDETVSWGILILFCILLFATTGREENTKPIGVCERIVCLGVIGLELLAFHMLMLIETPQGAEIISGVQGRYFLALMPLFLMLVYNNQKKYSREGIRRVFYLYACAECLYMYSFLKIFLAI